MFHHEIYSSISQYIFLCCFYHRIRGSFLISIVDQIKEDQFEDEEEGNLNYCDDAENHIGFGLLQFLQVILDVEDKEGNGVYHPVRH